VKSLYFPRADGSRIPFNVYRSPEIYELEQERIFRGPTWSFNALEAELPKPGDFVQLPSCATLQRKVRSLCCSTFFSSVLTASD
jgi:hypothetical protein